MSKSWKFSSLTQDIHSGHSYCSSKEAEKVKQRAQQVLLIILVMATSWLAMMAVHELGHVVHAIVSGGHVQRVVLHPLAISRTDVSPNPHPLFVAWGGAIWGTVIPLVLLAVVRTVAPKYTYLAAFFAGFC